jgi:hypothetical protein
MAERRTSARQKSFLLGRIYYNNRRQSADCLVRDLSEHGAKLVFSDVLAVPDSVELYLSNKETVQRVEVQWRRGNEVGVAFGTEASAGGHVFIAPTDLYGRVSKLESECASLRRAVGELRAQLRKSRVEVD